uniref:Uncharacterized protein n=1 Tax=Chromera velia CCMP2878 TaxID=1169474 RepID=A0A0G4I0D6_9ALVE|mmetsp:Transcript_26663/g.52338  ORF Transcript_26663/g.52338 Transcript_26663/m.52338 type:complete len:123 (-) Transcript_26663:368-736(-)|eukprot:Cvel_9927.t1-p1 / transcript=Cvel_9927.t1 / gene=Cvel_9927 / organism=Chromera_velia_CCMP2878 / gene_product=hypothetical protein / transcript_product=hypothetical protein / location=Cvel_scaffold586:61453-64675(-) / protein_length=122 / sequence_SO=supercontig / SO=protein_coding / is_pseudo=false
MAEAPKIEGAKPNFFVRAFNSISKPIVTHVKGPGVVHAVLVGAAVGVVAYEVGQLARFDYTAFLDTESAPFFSRQRYAEKQMAFEADLQHAKKTSEVLKLAKEYDPVALRTPFTHLSPSVRF